VIERGSAVESLVSGIGLHVDSEQIARVTREELQGPIRRAGMKWVHAERLGFGPGEWLARIGLASTPERLLQVDQAVRSVRLLNFGFRDQAFVIRKPGPGG